MQDHTLFVAAAYGVSAAVLAGLIVWLIFDARAQRRSLADLEASGVRRRSDSAA